MNIELIKKLTRLANNNPNENEANLAARRVCKMLEEGNWVLSSTSRATKEQQWEYAEYPWSRAQSAVYEEFFRGINWTTPPSYVQKQEYQCKECNVRFMSDSIYPTIECTQCKGEARRVRL